ncbi:MAG: bifunctional folylpolyglutamate synthase/dihydrofolate synthase [Coprococcus sp.]
MNYSEAMDYIESANTRGIMPGLARIGGLLEETEHPEMACNVIHVAGTNGKGSVCTYIASILHAAGYRVGRYISPTLYNYRERIQINGRWISEEEVAAWMSLVRDADDKVQSRGIGAASAFELETVLAFLYFKDKQCDFIILETGMGGRLDATNVVPRPVLSVITPIGMDHMQFLGDTIEAIAAEKGGIIKKGCPTVIGAVNRAAEVVLEKICRSKQAPYRMVKTAEAFVNHSSIEEGQYFDYGEFHNLRTGMLGSCQPGNAAIAIEAVKVLTCLDTGDFPAGIERLPAQYLDSHVIKEGIEAAVWPGRFEVIAKNPLVIVDGAHNPDGARALRDSVRQYLSGRRLILVMGVFADKDYKQMLNILSEVSDTLIAFKPEQARGLDAGKLSEAAAACFRYTEAAESQEQAIRKAFALGSCQDVILSFGSLSTVAGLERIIRRIADEKNRSDYQPSSV